METVIWAGMGAGLASVAGVRAFLPLALFGIFARFGFLVPPDILGLSTVWTVVGIFGALAVLEIVLEKVRPLDPAFGYVMVPFKIAAGAVLFETMLTPGAVLAVPAVPGLVAGGGIAAVVAVLQVMWRPSSSTSPMAGVSTAFLSAAEDVAAVVGGVLGLFVPFMSVSVVAFLLFFFYRIGKRRGRKYGGLRILGD